LFPQNITLEVSKLKSSGTMYGIGHVEGIVEVLAMEGESTSSNIVVVRVLLQTNRWRPIISAECG
jgi:hypothetical protein